MSMELPRSNADKKAMTPKSKVNWLDLCREAFAQEILKRSGPQHSIEKNAFFRASGKSKSFSDLKKRFSASSETGATRKPETPEQKPVKVECQDVDVFQKQMKQREVDAQLKEYTEILEKISQVEKFGIDRLGSWRAMGSLAEAFTKALQTKMKLSEGQTAFDRLKTPDHPNPSREELWKIMGNSPEDVELLKILIPHYQQESDSLAFSLTFAKYLKSKIKPDDPYTMSPLEAAKRAKADARQYHSPISESLAESERNLGPRLVGQSKNFLELLAYFLNGYAPRDALRNAKHQAEVFSSVIIETHVSQIVHELFAISRQSQSPFAKNLRKFSRDALLTSKTPGEAARKFLAFASKDATKIENQALEKAEARNEANIQKLREMFFKASAQFE